MARIGTRAYRIATIPDAAPCEPLGDAWVCVTATRPTGNYRPDHTFGAGSARVADRSNPDRKYRALQCECLCTNAITRRLEGRDERPADMRCRLLFHGANASHQCMRGHFISLLLIFAVLFGSTHLSALAHSHNADADHAVQIMDVDRHAVVVDDDGDSDSPVTGDMGQHHHCSSVLAISPNAPCSQSLLDRATLLPAQMAAMASLSGAPPTQPPSA